MHTIIDNEIHIFNPSLELSWWVKENLVVPNPTYQTLVKLGKIDTIRYKHITEKLSLFRDKGDELVLPYGTIYAIWKFIKDSPVNTKFNNNGKVININEPSIRPLYDYQQKAVDALLKAKGGVLVAPCSAGKTDIMSHVIHDIGQKFLFLVHTSDLLRQFYNRIKMLYPSMDIGIINEGEYRLGRHGAVATIQTMAKLDKDLYKNDFDVVICDECVHVVSSPTLQKMFGKVVGSIPARYKFGCTATPSRGDGMIKSMYTILGANENGDFAPTYTINKCETKSLTALHTKLECNIPFDYRCLASDGTFNYNALIDILSQNQERNDLIINTAINDAKQGEKVLILCHRVEHCKLLNDKMQELGQKSVLLVGKVSDKKREAILNESTDWDIIVATYSLAKEGLDLPCLTRLIMATPIADKGMTVQCVGRIERFKENKETPIAYDIYDTQYPYCVGKWKKRDAYLKRRY